MIKKMLLFAGLLIGFQLNAVMFRDRQCSYVFISLAYYDDEGQLHSYNESLNGNDVSNEEIMKRIDEIVAKAGNHRHIFSVRCLQDNEWLVDTSR